MRSDIVIVAMSGGVDSAVAAATLRDEGHDLVGITMRVWDNPADAEARAGSCCSLDDADDARRVAERLGVPHYTLNVKEAFRGMVVDYFVDEYMRGRTPNPCVLCNEAIKFDYLFQQGRKFGAARVATGHYAGIDTFMGHPVVKRGADPVKDQSYYLFSISPERLPRILFPLGGMSKAETRAMAAKLGLNVAGKAESQEICFVPDDDYKSFIDSLPQGAAVTEGEIVDAEGSVIGRHAGYPFYTVGQRRGLGVSAPRPLYVTAIDPANNRVVVGGKDELYGRALAASRVNWYVPPEELSGVALSARIRSRSPDAPAEVRSTGAATATVEFAEPQLSITPGQAVVFYHGDFVVGGGWIDGRID